jgi:hypothetical protein
VPALIYLKPEVKRPLGQGRSDLELARAKIRSRSERTLIAVEMSIYLSALSCAVLDAASRPAPFATPPIIERV